MAGVRVEVDIDATPTEVWTVIEPVERHVDWMADAVAIRFLGEQRRGVGTRFECDTKIGPITLVDVMEITAWTPGELMGVRHDGVVTGSGELALIPIDLGRRTRVVWSERLRFPWWLGGPVGAAIGGPTVLRVVWRRNLRRLARLAEAPPP